MVLIYLAIILSIAALIHAYFVAPIFFWPLASLLLSSIALSLHSPLAIGRGMTFLAHAQSHTILTASLAAVIPAAVFSIPLQSPLYTAMVLALLFLFNSAVLWAERLGLRGDVATGVVMSVHISAALALLYLLRTAYGGAADPLALITGEFLLATRDAFMGMLPAAFASLIFPAALGLRYLYSSVDPHFSATMGIKAKWHDYAFIASMSAAVASSVYVLGSLMPAVLLVMTGSTTERLTAKISEKMPASVAIGVISTATSHFIYTAIPWLWPAAALGLVLLGIMAATAVHRIG